MYSFAQRARAGASAPPPPPAVPSNASAFSQGQPCPRHLLAIRCFMRRAQPPCFPPGEGTLPPPPRHTPPSLTAGDLLCPQLLPPWMSEEDISGVSPVGSVTSAPSLPARGLGGPRESAEAAGPEPRDPCQPRLLELLSLGLRGRCLLGGAAGGRRPLPNVRVAVPQPKLIFKEICRSRTLLCPCYAVT